MNKGRLLIIIVVFSLSLIVKVPSSFALPYWWNNYTFATDGSGQFTRPNVEDPSIGEFEIHLENLGGPQGEKLLYFVLKWSTTDQGSSVILEPVWFSCEPLYPNMWWGGNKLVERLENGTHHLEYSSYTPPPYPDEEWAMIQCNIGIPGNTIDYSYDFRSFGIPEPATIALLGLGGLALVRRRKG